jgi:pyruvate dehydrogenase E1 component beta subunit
MTTYVQHLNHRLCDAILRHDRFVSFGQNIDAGSCLSGLTRGLPKHDRHLVINTPNVENTLAGVGFGLMMRGMAGAFIMKQLDFLLLGIDQLVNTWNVLREQDVTGSFTIVAIVVDGGYAGPQSSFNGLYDFCSIARIPGFAVTNQLDIDTIMAHQFGEPGFRIITVSERLFRAPLIEWDRKRAKIFGDGEVIRYARGEAATIACCNLSFPQGMELAAALDGRGAPASLFGVHAAHPVDWTPIIHDVRRTGQLVLLDDSKSWNAPYRDLMLAAQAICGPENVHLIARGAGELRPNADTFVVPVDWLCRKIARKEAVRSA